MKRVSLTIRLLVVSSFLVYVAARSGAAPIEFNLKDAKGVNNVAFKLEAPVEKISGTATGISGLVTFDPAAPGSVNGKLVLATASLHVPNPKMNGHLHGPDWMDATRHPEITFEVLSAKNVKTETNVTTAEITGNLTIKGTTKEVTVPVKMTYLKDKLKLREGKEGDLLVLQGTFGIKRRDFGINPGNLENKVADLIQLTLSLVGSAPRQ